jgi:hypothetical protein
MIFACLKITLGRGGRSNQRLDVGYGLEFEENDAKTQRRTLADYFSSVFPERFLLCCRLKKGLNKD